MAEVRRTSLRSVVGGAAGNLVEWFDWYVYSAFSIYFARIFFPAGDQTAQLLATSGIFWAGFLMRPIGGWLLGRLADRHGRRTALNLSVAAMCAGSLLIACVPGYGMIGRWAPALLLLARMVQGLSLGGEYGAAATYLVEVSHPDHRGFWSSFQYVTLYGGQLIALGVLLLLQFALLDEWQLAAWGWRLAFLLGAALALVIAWLRRGIEETPAFRGEAVPQRGGRVRRLWAQHRRAVLIAFGLAIGSNVAFYCFTTYMQKYLVASAGLAKGSASLVCAAATLVAILVQPLGGALSDRIGRKPLVAAFGCVGLVATVPLMLAIGAVRTPGAAFPLVACGMLLISLTTSTNAVTKAELFPPEVRALGVGLPYAVSQSLFGGSAEALALGLKRIGHEAWFFWYVAAMCGVSLVTVAFMPETRWRARGA